MAKRQESDNRASKNRGQQILTSLKRQADRRNRAAMETRYGIRTRRALGVPMSAMLSLAKRIGTDHELALTLWDTGWYEARIVAALVDDPDRVSPRQMDRWCRDFDNWGLCDTVCFKLFDRTRHAYPKVAQWANSPDEFVRRAAFALLACLALHDKAASDHRFVRCLPLIVAGAQDGRNFVKKAVSWALRAIGERNAELHEKALRLAERLGSSEEAGPRWVGKDALRQLTAASTIRRLKARQAKASLTR